VHRGRRRRLWGGGIRRAFFLAPGPHPGRAACGCVARRGGL